MRIAHATDIHWTTPVPWSRLPGKRVLGTANQIFGGRRHHFPEEVQRSLVDHLLDLAPDLVVITGDLTAQALPEEFEKARRFLGPVLESIPTLILAGNHDVYTRGAQQEDRIRTWFGPWLHRDGPLGRWEDDRLVVLALDPNRPTGLNASGRVPDDQLQALAAALDDPGLDGRGLILALHYPVVDRRGAVYDNARHGLVNARDLIDVLRGARSAPSLLIHGHEHHGFRAEIELGSRTVVACDCGSSGYAFMPGKRRAAAMNVYTWADGRFAIERYLHDGARFTPEPGGAYATGR